jgi:hypothetical protein
MIHFTLLDGITVIAGTLGLDSSVARATRPNFGGAKELGTNSRPEEDIPLQRPARPWGQTSWVLALGGLKWPGREADESPPSSAEIKN